MHTLGSDGRAGKSSDLRSRSRSDLLYSIVIIEWGSKAANVGVSGRARKEPALFATSKCG